MEQRKSNVRIWGYVPAASLQRAPILQPTRVPQHALQEDIEAVCSGGCGFALAITESGKLVMWGSSNDLGQSQSMTGSQQERLEPYLLDLNERVVQAAGGWAHSVAVTDSGQVCTWGWSACAPAASPATEQRAPVLPISTQGDEGSALMRGSQEKESESCNQIESNEALSTSGNHIAENCQQTEHSRGDLSSNGASQPHLPTRQLAGLKGPFRFDKTAHNLRQSLLDVGESPSDERMGAADYNVKSLLWLMSLSAGVIVTSVAAGGRHTLALSDTGKVWGWGHSQEGQLGLGSRRLMVSTPCLIPGLEGPLWTSDVPSCKDESLNLPLATRGTCVTRIACGGRHSAVLTDSGAVLAFGWGLYGQCGQGSTEDQLSPVHVAALGGMKVTGLSAGLWHTVCITDEGDVYSTGGNQFGQLGTMGDQAEMLPTLVDAPVLENERAVSVSCGARHTAILTDKGKVFCWGWNKYGQLGVGDSVDRDTPVETSMGNRVATSLACGWWHTLAVVEDLL